MSWSLTWHSKKIWETSLVKSLIKQSILQFGLGEKEFEVDDFDEESVYLEIILDLDSMYLLQHEDTIDLDAEFEEENEIVLSFSFSSMEDGKIYFSACSSDGSNHLVPDLLMKIGEHLAAIFEAEFVD